MEPEMRWAAIGFLVVLFLLGAFAARKGFRTLKFALDATRPWAGFQ